ncbi:hypothetical protein DV532_29185 (plasmid) [Pseudomonas sp. Leaf58]|nr:hypothetical protein DV532_29185 [Pseudomonas sp. Leaf58]
MGMVNFEIFWRCDTLVAFKTLVREIAVSFLMDCLCDRHPMMRGHPFFVGVETGDGWHDLLEDLCTKLEAEIESSGCPPMTVSQVKQKFGTLRFYASGGNQRCRDLISEAEAVLPQRAISAHALDR